MSSSDSDARPRRGPSLAGDLFPWGVGLVLLGLYLTMTSGSLTADLDMFHEMALARESLGAGHLLRHDVHAYTPTNPVVVHHEWGTGVVLYGIVVGLGWGGAGVLILRHLLLLVALGCAAWVAHRRGAGLATVAPLVPVALFLMAPGFAPVRAQLFTFAFVGLLLVGFELDRRGNRWWVWAWLLLYVVWLNLHGGFVVGAGLFGIHLLERAWREWRREKNLGAAWAAVRHLVAAAAAMAVLWVVNPYGLAYGPYIVHALTLDRAMISEWAPLWDPRVPPFTVLVFTAAVGVLAYTVWRADGPFPGLPLIILVGGLTLTSQRLVPVFGVLWLGFAPGWLARTPLGEALRGAGTRWRRGLAVGSLLLGPALIALTLPTRWWDLRLPTSGNARASSVFPVGAVDYLADNGFTGNVMTTFRMGGFVAWHLFPHVRVGLDSRYEVAYPPGTAEAVVAMYGGEDGWQDELARYPDTDMVLVPRDAGLYGPISASTAWNQVYIDDEYALFARPDVSANLPSVDRRGTRLEGRFP